MEQQQLPHKTARTILKSAAAQEAKLELADINPFHSKRSGFFSSAVNNVRKPNAIINEERLRKGKIVQARNSEVRNTSFSNSKSYQIDSTDDDSEELLNLSSITSSMLENISVDDINTSVLAHDGSQDKLVSPFNFLQPQPQENSILKPSFLPTSTLQIDFMPKDRNQIPTDNKTESTVYLASDVLLQNVAQQPSNNDPVGSLEDLQNSENQNSMEISFDESRGHGPICSSGLEFELPSALGLEDTSLLCSEMTNRLHGSNTNLTNSSNLSVLDTAQKTNNTSFSTHKKSVATEMDSDGLVTAAATTSKTITSSTTTKAQTDTGTATTSDGTTPNTVDLDLTELARAKSGNPENLYGLLAGFIKTGKNSTNTITINLSQCYNCDGSCVRNTISISSLEKKEKLIVTDKGIANNQHLNQDSALACNSTVLKASASKTTKKKKIVATPKVSSSSSSNFTEVQGTLIPSPPHPCSKVILQAPKFTPYDVDVTTSINNQPNQQPGPEESSFLSPANVLPLEIQILSEPSDETYSTDRNATFVVNACSSNSLNTLQPQVQSTEILANLDEDVMPSIAIGSETATAHTSVNFSSQLDGTGRITKKRKRGAMKPKKKLKSKPTTAQFQLKNSNTSSKFKMNVVARTLKIKDPIFPPCGPPAKRIRKSYYPECPVLSPQVDTRSSRTKPKTMEVKKDKQAKAKVTKSSCVPEYLHLFVMDVNEENGLKNILYSCKKCEFKTVGSVTSDRKLKNHYHKHKKPFEFKCSYCPKVFTAISSTNRHILKCKKNPFTNANKQNSCVRDALGLGQSGQLD